MSSLEQANPSILAEAIFLSWELQLGFALSGDQILTCVLAYWLTGTGSSETVLATGTLNEESPFCGTTGFHFGASELAQIKYQQLVKPEFQETSLTFSQDQHQLAH